MKLNMDSIQFESRMEIANIYNALEEFLTWCKKPDDDEDMIDDVRKLRDMLEVMEMNW